jgi:hypothetical protein
VKDRHRSRLGLLQAHVRPGTRPVARIFCCRARVAGPFFLRRPGAKNGLALGQNRQMVARARVDVPVGAPVIGLGETADALLCATDGTAAAGDGKRRAAIGAPEEPPRRASRGWHALLLVEGAAAIFVTDRGGEAGALSGPRNWSEPDDT